jgi:hypothetical protein
MHLGDISSCLCATGLAVQIKAQRNELWVI